MVVMEGGRGLMEGGRGWYEGQDLQGLSHNSSSPHPGLSHQTDSPHSHSQVHRQCMLEILILCEIFFTW